MGSIGLLNISRSKKLLKDGSLELITRIKVEGANIKTDAEVASEELSKMEVEKVLVDFEEMMKREEAADFKICCEGKVFNCHKGVLMTR